MKDRFESTFRQFIKRDGADRLLEWIGTTDFYSAPASTKFHSAYEGGLVAHSLNVCKRLLSVWRSENGREPNEQEMESIAIVGLLHDICKANFYDVEYRNRKNDFGQWEKYPCYIVNDQLPYGHGEKSVYIVSGFMRLTREEAMAIRWHMGFSDTDFKGGGYGVGNAFDKFPLAVMAHIADLQATYFDETESQ